MEFKTTTLGKFIKVQGGFAYKSKDFQNEDGRAVLKIKNVRFGNVDYSETAYINDELAEQTKAWATKEGDILISMTGSGPNAPQSLVGRVARVWKGDPQAWMNQRVGRIVVKPETLHPDFIFYLLTLPQSQDFLVSNSTGSANQANISGKTIELLPCPSLDFIESERIATIFRSLDEKIILNRQINQTLEQMAQTLFKSWFVDFDPVIDNALAAGNPIPPALAARAEGRKSLQARADQPAELTRSGNAPQLPDHIRTLFPDRFTHHPDMGWIPEGWEVGGLSSLAETITDGAHKSPASVDAGAGMPMASSKDLTSEGVNLESCRHISKYDFDELVRGGCAPAIGDVLISKDGSRCGETCCIYSVEDDVVLLSSVAIIRPKSPELSTYINVLLSRKESIADLRENYVSGSAIPRIVLRDFKRFPALIPSMSVLSAWDKNIDQVYKKRIAIQLNTQKLNKLRDTLLPKLISGELRLPEENGESIKIVKQKARENAESSA